MIYIQVHIANMDATPLAIALTATIVGAGTAAAIAVATHTVHLAPKL